MFIKKNFITTISVCALAIIAFFVVPAFAADGSGTASVSPTTATAGSTGNTHTFTFTAGEAMDSGGISITTPVGWTAMQGTNGVAGYTTAASSLGTIGDVVNALDTTTNWTATQHMALTADSADKQEGTASLSNAITATAAANEQWYFNYGAASNWGTSNGVAVNHIGFWLKSSVNTASGDISWQDDNSANLASPLESVAIPALTANTWTYTSVPLAVAVTSVSSYGFRYTNDIGVATIKADSITKIFDTADATTGWNKDASITLSSLTTAGNFKEGTGAVRCSYAAGAGINGNGDCFDNETAAFTTGPDAKVSFWIRSSVALNAGDFAFVDDDSNNMASPRDTINLPALSANTWTYLVLSAPNIGSARGYGVRQLVDKGVLTIDLDAIGNVIDSGDATSGWMAPTATMQTVSTDSSVFKENSASLKNVITAGAVAGDNWYQTFGTAQNWSAYTTVGFWIRSTVATNAGDLKFQYASSSDLSSPIASVNIGALSPNTWTYQKLTLSGTRTSVSSYGINYATDIGAATVNLDDVLIGPGSPTFPGGGVANLRFVSLANGQTATVTYGSGGGASGATAPITVESDTFTTKSRINDSGSLVNIATSPAVSVVAGPVSQFFLNDPGNATVGNRLGYTVTRKDQYGNLVTNGSTTVYLYSNSTGANKKFYDAASAGNIITSITIGNGSSSANFWYYDETPGNWTITTSDNASAPDGATGVADATDAVTYAAGSVSQFSLNDPGDTTAGTRLGYTVTRKDSFGNLVTSGANTIYLYSSSAGVNKKFYDASSAGNIITSVTIGNGSSSANFWTYDELSGTFTISASDNSSSPDGVTGIVDATDSVVISADATSQFTLNDPGNFAAGSRIGYTVTRKDQFNNLVTLGSNTVYLYSNSTGANKKFYDAAIAGNVITSIAIGNGSSSANFWYFDDKAGTWTITASDNSSVPDGATGISDATDSITINISATRFVILNPTDATAGDNVAVTVQAQDAEGNVDTGYQNDVTLVASGSATGAGVIDIVNGVGTKVISDTVAETVNLSLSDSQSTGLNVGSTQDVIFAAGPTAQFLINDPGNTIAGNRIGYIVTRKDQYGNPVTSGSNTVYLYSSSTGANKKFYDAATSGTVVTSVVIGSTTSTAQFWYYDEIPGTYTITASDNSSAPDGAAGIADATDSITILEGAVSQFTLSNPGDMTAGTRLPFSVTRRDQLGNPIITGSDVVYLYSNSTGANKKFYDAASGGNVITSISIDAATSSAQFWYYDETPGSWTITASDSASAPDGAVGIADAAQSTLVNSGTATQFTLNSPANIAAGNRGAYTVIRKDQFGNLATAGSTTVYLYSNSTGANKKFYDAASGGADITSITIGSGNSSADFWYYDELAGSWAITASDSATSPDGATGIADATDNLLVSTGSTAQYLITHPATMIAGNRLGHTVTRKDQYGNEVTTGTNTVYLYSDSTGANKRFYDASSAGNVVTSVVIGATSSTANFWYYDDAAGNWTVTVSDNSSAPDGATGIQDASNSIAVAPAATAQFILNDPGDMVTSTRIGYTVTRKDQFGNEVVTGSDTAYLYSSSTGSNKAFYDAAINNNTITSVAFGATSSTAHFWYYDEAVGTWTITASDNSSAPNGTTGIDDGTDSLTVSDTPVVATRFIILPPTNGTVGDHKTITIEAQDESGRVDTAYTHDVTLQTNGAATGAGVVDIVNGVGTISITDTVAQTVDLSLLDSQATGLIFSSTQQITFAPGAVSQFVLSNPGGITAGTRAAYTVTRKDQYGNDVVVGSDTVYLYTNSSNSLGKFYGAAIDASVLTSINIAPGNANASFWYYDETSGNWQITASDNATSPDDVVGISDDTDLIVVTPGSTAQFTINNPGSMTAGTRLGYAATRKDQFGNLVTTGTDTVYVYSSSTGSQAKFYSAASGGSVITSFIITTGHSSGDFWYYDELPGTWAITASDNLFAPDDLTGIDDAVDNVTVSAAPIVATRFVILDPADTTAGGSSTVTIEAQDDAGNIDTTYQSDVTLVTDGSATGAGLVNIVNGVGTKTITDAAGETITLSLVDIQSTGLDVSSVQDLLFATLPIAQLSSLGVEVYAAPNTLRIAGQAYPGASVTLIEKNAPGDVIVKRSIAAASGNFEITSSAYQSGEHLFALLIKDKDGRSAQTRGFLANFTLGTLDVMNLIIPPTTALTRSTVTRGDFIKVIGYAAPQVGIQIELDHDILYETTSNDRGAYELLINTARFEPGMHSVRARQLSAFTNRPSEYSLSKNFNVSTLTVPKADLNNDGTIDIRDSSIFLELYRQKNKKADLNNDGKVDVSDLSIFLRAFNK